MIFPWHKGLWNQLRERQARQPHALLIHGPAGIGKLALAEHYAQSLLCEAADPLRPPCGECDGCRWFIAGSHPDFRRVEPESLARQPEEVEEPEDPAPAAGKRAKPSSEIKVDQVRALDGFLNLKSHRGARRVALVHPAEDMNPNAANALLKGLEEPPPGAFFLLVSHRPARLLATIRSRCVAVPVPTPDPAASAAWLAQQGAKDAGQWLAFASGAPLLALQYAQGSGAALARARDALRAGDRASLASVNDREQLEALAEILQKHALDVAFASYCGEAKYGEAKASRNAMAWLRYARKAGRNRMLARHPLNPRLFIGEMLGEMPEE
jgi:DNA polymerase III subunit delta'